LGRRRAILDVTDITRVARAKKLRNNDILVIGVGATEHPFMGGFDTWDPLLRRLLTQRHGRTIVEDGPDAWTAQA